MLKFAGIRGIPIIYILILTEKNQRKTFQNYFSNIICQNYRGRAKKYSALQAQRKWVADDICNKFFNSYAIVEAKK